MSGTPSRLHFGCARPLGHACRRRGPGSRESGTSRLPPPDESPRVRDQDRAGQHQGIHRRLSTGDRPLPVGLEVVQVEGPSCRSIDEVAAADREAAAGIVVSEPHLSVLVERERRQVLPVVAVRIDVRNQRGVDHHALHGYCVAVGERQGNDGPGSPGPRLAPDIPTGAPTGASEATCTTGGTVSTAATGFASAATCAGQTTATAGPLARRWTVAAATRAHQRQAAERERNHPHEVPHVVPHRAPQQTSSAPTRPPRAATGERAF